MNDSTPKRPCSKCGVEYTLSETNWYKDKRLKSGLRSICKLCDNAKCSKWESDNRERKNALSRRSKAKRRVEIKAKSKIYRDNNKDKIRAKDARNNLSNPQRKRNNFKTWAVLNPDKIRVNKQRRRAKEKQLPSDFTANDWQRALDYFGHCCAVCGKAADFFTVLAMDHWKPLDRGGATVADNIVPLCHPKPGVPAGEPCCNSSKGHKLPEVWLVERFGKRKARVILKRIQGYFDWLKSQ